MSGRTTVSEADRKTPNRNAYMRAYRARWRAENSDRYTSDRDTKYRAFRDWIDQLKIERGCLDCGYNAAPEALHFDHRDPTEKHFEIGPANSRSRPSVLAEIDKCDVRCANCHAIRTKRDQHHLSRRSD